MTSIIKGQTPLILLACVLYVTWYVVTFFWHSNRCDSVKANERTHIYLIWKLEISTMLSEFNTPPILSGPLWTHRLIECIWYVFRGKVIIWFYRSNKNIWGGGGLKEKITFWWILLQRTSRVHIVRYMMTSYIFVVKNILELGSGSINRISYDE